MNKLNAHGAGTRTPRSRKAPGVRADAKGRREATSKQRNFTAGTRQAQSKPRTLGQMASAAIPLAAELYELLHRQAATVADAPAEALADHPNVTSWHTISGGFGRLSDQVHTLNAWLKATRSEFFIGTAAIKVSAGGRNGIVKAYTLKCGVTVADCRQLGLFPEGVEQ